MTDSGRILQASKVYGCFGEIRDGKLLLSNGSEDEPEAVPPHFEVTIDFVDEWLGRNVEALVINNVCVRLSDRENGLAYPEVAALPTLEVPAEADDSPRMDAHEHDEAHGEAPAMEAVEAAEEDEADDEVPEIPSFAVRGEAPVMETVESAEIESVESVAEDEAAAEPPPVQAPSHSYALSQVGSLPRADDYRNGEADQFRF